MTAKISTESLDIIDARIKLLKQIIPECVTEGKIDFSKLKKTLGETLDSNDEKYTFSWAGRNDTFKNLQIPSKGTIVTVQEESINFDSTQNLFIEGDNLEVLKLLQKTYFEKLKMIYIDPPYNTGRDFIYKDNFTNSIQSYLEQTGQIEGGIKLTTNPETSGRFHSDWISMMYPRLFIARNMLREDGIIFVSIGQKELHNLILILNEIFGEENRVGIISRLMKSGGNKGEYFSPNIDYILVYAKNITFADSFRLSLETEYIDRIYTETEVKGPLKGERYREMGLYQGYLEKRKNQRYWIKCPDGSFAIPPGKTFPSQLKDGAQVEPQRGDGVWRWIYETYHDEFAKDGIVFKKTNSSGLLNEKGEKSNWNIYSKIWLKDRMEEGRVPTDLITKYENRHSSAELKELDIPFDFAKPSKLISYLMSFFEGDDLTVLDFFAGSGTTAQSVLELNNEDGGNRKFILIQLPEPIPKDSEAYEQGYKNIAEIAKARIRQVIKKIIKTKSQTKLTEEKEVDLGFKVFKLTKSNFQIWENYEGKDTKKLKEQMKLFQSPLIPGAKEQDVIYECIVKEGFDLNSKIEKIDVKTNNIYRVSDSSSFFYITLDKTIKDETFDKLGLSKDDTFICIDASLNDSNKTNLAKQCNLKTI